MNQKDKISSSDIPEGLSPSGRLGKPVLGGAIMNQALMMIQKDPGTFIIKNEELGEGLGERIPDKFPSKKKNSDQVTLVIPEEPIRNKYSAQILKLPSIDDFDKMIGEGGNLYQYIINSRDDIELYQGIVDDLKARIFGIGEKNTKSIDGLLGGLKHIMNRTNVLSQIKKDVRSSQTLTDIFNYIGSSEFRKTYKDLNIPIVQFFFDQKIKPRLDSDNVNRFWHTIKLILKKNISAPQYDLYTKDIKLRIKRHTVGSDSVPHICLEYTGDRSLFPKFVELFEDDVINLMVDHIKTHYGLNIFHYCSFQYDAVGNRKMRSESEIKNILSKKTILRVRSKPNQGLVIHDDNLEICRLLQGWLDDQLSVEGEDITKNCFIYGAMGAGKSTAIKHYLYELQKYFPKARIHEVGVVDFARQVQSIGAEKNPEVKAQLFNDFIGRINDYDVLYLTEFEQIIKDKYWLKEQLLKVIEKGKTRFIVESTLDPDFIEKAFKKETGGSDPSKRQKRKHDASKIRQWILNDYSTATSNPPSVVARNHIIQEIAKSKINVKLPEAISSELASSLLQLGQCKNTINRIKNNLKSVLDLNDVAKKIVHQELKGNIILKISKVHGWFEEFCEVKGVPQDGKLRGEMFVIFAHIMTEKISTWNPHQQLWKIEDIAREARVKYTKSNFSSKLDKRFHEHKLYHGSWVEYLKKQIEESIAYGSYGLRKNTIGSSSITVQYPS